MSEFFKITVFVFCSVLLSGFLKSTKKEYSYFVALACGIAILCISVPKITTIISEVRELSDFSAQWLTAVKIFFKCVFICEICSLTKAFCLDSSNTFIASCVDIAEKAFVLIAAMPLFESVIAIIVKFIGG